MIAVRDYELRPLRIDLALEIRQDDGCQGEQFEARWSFACKKGCLIFRHSGLCEFKNRQGHVGHMYVWNGPGQILGRGYGNGEAACEPKTEPM